MTTPTDEAHVGSDREVTLNTFEYHIASPPTDTLPRLPVYSTEPGAAVVKEGESDMYLIAPTALVYQIRPENESIATERGPLMGTAREGP